MIHTNGYTDVPTPQSVRWWLQLTTRQLGLQQNISWPWEPGLLGNIEQPWTVEYPKRNNQLLLPMERRHYPRPGLREFRPGQPTAVQTCSRKVPEVTISAFPHNATELKVPAHSDPVKRWNFRKADWKRFCLMNPSRDRHIETEWSSAPIEPLIDLVTWLEPKLWSKNSILNQNQKIAEKAWVSYWRRARIVITRRKNMIESYSNPREVLWFALKKKLMRFGFGFSVGVVRVREGFALFWLLFHDVITLTMSQNCGSKFDCILGCNINL